MFISSLGAARIPLNAGNTSGQAVNGCRGKEGHGTQNIKNSSFWPWVIPGQDSN